MIVYLSFLVVALSLILVLRIHNQTLRFWIAAGILIPACLVWLMAFYLVHIGL